MPLPSSSTNASEGEAKFKPWHAAAAIGVIVAIILLWQFAGIATLIRVVSIAAICAGGYFIYKAQWAQAISPIIGGLLALKFLVPIVAPAENAVSSVISGFGDCAECISYLQVSPSEQLADWQWEYEERGFLGKLFATTPAMEKVQKERVQVSRKCKRTREKNIVKWEATYTTMLRPKLYWSAVPAPESAPTDDEETQIHRPPGSGDGGSSAPKEEPAPAPEKKPKKEPMAPKIKKRKI